MFKQNIFRFFTNNSGYNLINHQRLPIVHQVAGIKQETKEALKLLNVPEKPKRPPSAFMRFLKEKRPSILANKPSLSFGEIAKIGGEHWRTLDVSTKEKYQEAYKKEVEDYTKKFLEYETNLTEAQRSVLKQQKIEKKQEKNKRELRKMFRETEKPKRPPSAYIMFSMDYAKSVNSTPLKIAKEVKGRWEALSESERQKYQQRYVDVKKKFDAELEQWEAKMMKEGKAELVRRKVTQPKLPSRLDKDK